MEYKAGNIREVHDDSGKDSKKSETKDGYEVQNDNSGKDKISELPEDCLHQILSYLPSSKDIVRMSTLSRRWRSLWTWFSIHTFDYHLDLKQGPDRILVLVERELNIPHNARIAIFRIYFEHTYNSKIISIMESVSESVKHYQVEELHFCFRNIVGNFEIFLPCALFTCRSLISLKLDMNRVTVTNSDIPSLSFPKLKTLHLKYITFQDNCFAGQFFTGCLVLKELILDDCSWNTTSDITIAVPSLQRLSINLNKNLSNYPLIIRCPILKFFEFSSSCWDFNLVLDLLLLVKAYINIRLIKKTEIYPECRIQLARTLELLERICGVESLRLSFETLQTICYVEDVLADELPTFHNLTRLKLLGGYPDITASALLHILHKSPKLQSIAFPDGLNVDNFQEETRSLKDDVPVCLIHCLERFTVCRFWGNDGEVLFLKHILKHASGLKLFSVHCMEELSQNLEEKEKISLELKQLCKEHCEFSFI